MPLTVGDRLGHYDVTALIGEGGMGEVYEATDTRLDRTVTIKVLPESELRRTTGRGQQNDEEERAEPPCGP